ncbi:MAG: ATPase, T2SS/T4P/T4SS family, partial [SAR324 cluster bacterium]|nr:ATPase, T2SS/T4P/T4SS family [SAR324 cluster bacterium]
TGHTVFSTVHTNDAPSTMTRLVDMGIQPYLVSSTVVCVLAQRLLRRICTSCKVEVPFDPALLKELGLTGQEVGGLEKVFKGEGCSKCRSTGFRGRVGLFELLIMNDAIKKILLETNEANQIREVAQANGMISMRQTGIEMVKRGETTVDELISVTRED